MKKTIFITGISTDVGKTVVSAIISQALKADYWKPVQAGDLSYCDSHKVEELTDYNIVIHPNSYALKTPMSPHAAAAIENINLSLDNIIIPKTDNHLVIEGAGGLLVPLNDKHTVLDIIKPQYKVIVVSRHYLGSINHTLMTLQILKQKKINIEGIIFSGNKNPSTESIIQKMSGVNVLGRIDEEPFFDKSTVSTYAKILKQKLKKL